VGVDVVDLLRGEARWEERWGWGGGGGGNERGVSFIREMKRRKKRPEFRREKNGKKIDSPALTACSMHAFTPLPSGLGSVMWCASHPKAPPANSQMMFAPRLWACSSDSSTRTPAPS